jgi:hypothetical protein
MEQTATQSKMTTVRMARAVSLWANGGGDTGRAAAGFDVTSRCITRAKTTSQR